MKAYGYSRRAKLECRFGCCAERDANKHVNARKSNDAARRKAARRVTPRLFTSLIEA
jgi:hypothetical protein